VRWTWVPPVIIFFQSQFFACHLPASAAVMECSCLPWGAKVNPRPTRGEPAVRRKRKSNEPPHRHPDLCGVPLVQPEAASKTHPASSFPQREPAPVVVIVDVGGDVEPPRLIWHFLIMQSRRTHRVPTPQPDPPPHVSGSPEDLCLAASQLLFSVFPPDNQIPLFSIYLRGQGPIRGFR
jgi:hypothetical protein